MSEQPTSNQEVSPPPEFAELRKVAQEMRRQDEDGWAKVCEAGANSLSTGWTQYHAWRKRAEDAETEIERLRAREKRMLDWMNYYRAKWMGEAAMPCPPVPAPLDLQETGAADEGKV